MSGTVHSETRRVRRERTTVLVPLVVRCGPQSSDLGFLRFRRPTTVWKFGVPVGQSDPDLGIT